MVSMLIEIKLPFKIVSKKCGISQIISEEMAKVSDRIDKLEKTDHKKELEDFKKEIQDTIKDALTDETE